MDLLKFLAELGISTWIIVFIVLVFIFEKIGIFQFVKEKLKASTEFQQSQIEAKNAAEQSEQVVLWSQMTRLQSQTLQQNELLLEFVISTSRDWHGKHADCLDEVLERQQAILYELKQMAGKFTILVGVIERDYDRAKKPDDGQSGNEA